MTYTAKFWLLSQERSKTAHLHVLLYDSRNKNLELQEYYKMATSQVGEIHIPSTIVHIGSWKHRIKHEE